MSHEVIEREGLSGLIGSPPSGSAGIELPVPRALRAIRTHLGMDVAFVAEFCNGHRVFRAVEPTAGAPMRPGDSDPLEETYCQRVADGRLPEIIPDACANAEARKLAVTTALGIGAHISVPIRLQDGALYGTFCCFSFSPDSSLGERDLHALRAVADVIAGQIERELAAHRERDEMRARIEGVLASDAFSSVYQPIVCLDSSRVAGFEALTRFSAAPARAPDAWFNEAVHVGMGCELEMRTITRALRALPHLPPDAYLGINASPEAVMCGSLHELLAGAPLSAIVLEITEHAMVAQYSAIAAALEPLRSRGMRVAVDDAGAGYASFRHILSLTPELIKLDMSLTRSIDTDKARRCLATALITFARETGSTIVAEGIETASELACLRELGVTRGQGYLLGRPRALA